MTKEPFMVQTQSAPDAAVTGGIFTLGFIIKLLTRAHHYVCLYIQKTIKESLFG